jgi:hypothetical protein
MCEGPFSPGGLRPEYELSQLIAEETQTGPIPPATLRLFLLAHWGKAAPLAHAIHDSTKPKKPDVPQPSTVDELTKLIQNQGVL